MYFINPLQKQAYYTQLWEQLVDSYYHTLLIKQGQARYHIFKKRAQVHDEERYKTKISILTAMQALLRFSNELKKHGDTFSDKETRDYFNKLSHNYLGRAMLLSSYVDRMDGNKYRADVGLRIAKDFLDKAENIKVTVKPGMLSSVRQWMSGDLKEQQAKIQEVENALAKAQQDINTYWQFNPAFKEDINKLLASTRASFKGSKGFFIPNIERPEIPHSLSNVEPFGQQQGLPPEKPTSGSATERFDKLFGPQDQQGQKPRTPYKLPVKPGPLEDPTQRFDAMFGSP